MSEARTGGETLEVDESDGYERRADRPTMADRAQLPESLDATLVIQMGYRGAGFAGFAAQPGQRTVAGEVTRALEVLLRRPIVLTCAGRTDSGVHALAQYVSVPVTASECSIRERRLIRGLEALLPDDIAPRAVYRAPAGFSARFDALSRSYRYRICAGQTRPICAWDFSWWIRDSLDIDAMNQAAASLIGELDFKSFCKATSAIDKPTHRYLSEVRVHEEIESLERLIYVDVTGNAFLHSMVRTLTGTLVEVGRAHRSPEWVAEALAAKDRRAAGPCAPAHGLMFVSVAYPDGVLQPWDTQTLL